MDWDELRAEIRTATRAAFGTFLAEHPDEAPYAYCLYTDSDGGSVVTAANTEEGYRLALDAWDDHATPEDAAYVRWAPAEWAYEAAEDPALFRDICRKLFANPGPRADQLDRLIGAMTDALAALRSEPAFQALAPAPVLFVTISDDDRMEAVENASAQALNEAGAATAFLGRYGRR